MVHSSNCSEETKNLLISIGCDHFLTDMLMLRALITLKKKYLNVFSQLYVHATHLNNSFLKDNITWTKNLKAVTVLWIASMLTGLASIPHMWGYLAKLAKTLFSSHNTIKYIMGNLSSTYERRQFKDYLWLEIFWVYTVHVGKIFLYEKKPRV